MAILLYHFYLVCTFHASRFQASFTLQAAFDTLQILRNARVTIFHEVWKQQFFKGSWWYLKLWRISDTLVNHFRLLRRLYTHGYLPRRLDLVSMQLYWDLKALSQTQDFKGREESEWGGGTITKQSATAGQGSCCTLCSSELHEGNASCMLPVPQ